MGVHGLWKLIEPVGKPVPLESLENKVLAVDVSIWLYQLMTGFQSTGGGTMPNAHILGLFNRICKLLYYRIKPVFVFDGGMPFLKKETIEARKLHKLKAKDTTEKLRERLLSNLLKQKALDGLSSKDDESMIGTKSTDIDMFALPPLPEINEIEDDIEDEDDDTELNSAKVDSFCSFQYGKDLHSVDITSEQFKSLPAEIRHEILSELQDTRKQNSWACIHDMPEEASDFSKFQMNRLIKRRNVTKSIDTAAKEMGGRTMTMTELEAMFVEDKIVTDTLPGRRIASDNVTRYVYITGNKDTNETEKMDSFDCKQPSSAEKSSLSSKESSERDDSDYISKSFEIDKCLFTHYSSSEDDSNEFEYAKQLSRYESVSQDEILRQIQQCNATESKQLANEKLQSEFRPILETDENMMKEEKDPTDAHLGKNEYDKSMSRLHKMIDAVGEYKNTETEVSECSAQPIIASSSCESDSDDGFVEVTETETKSCYFSESENHSLEIILDPRTIVPDDFFSDVFELKDVSTKSKEETSVASTKGAHEIVAIDLKERKTATKSSKIKNESTSSEDARKIGLNDTKRRILVDKSLESEKNLNNTQTTEKLKIKTSCSELQFNSDVSSIVTRTCIKSAEGNQALKSDTDRRVKNIADIMKKKKVQEEKVVSVSETIDEIEDNEKPSTQVTDEKFREIQKMLTDEKSQLLAEKGKQERFGATVTQQMVIEAQELLKLFGLPYIVAPMEAEAQCAFLEQISLTDGTITDDSDVWLFGGQKVYKNFFDNRKHVLQFRDVDIEHFFKLSRAQLIQMALLVGSDYTVGIEGVGPITAIEILAYFSDNSNKAENESVIAETLRKFKKWAEQNRNGSSVLSRKMKNVHLSEGFPNLSVIKAYLHPTVDDSKDKFTWGIPDVDCIRQYMKTRFGWKIQRIDEILLPVMKRLSCRNKQTTLDSYLKTLPHNAVNFTSLSHRVVQAVSLMKNKVEGDTFQVPKTSPRKKPSSFKARKRKSEKEDTSLLRREIDLPLTNALPSSPSTSCCSSKEEIIPQRQQAKREAAKRRMKAVKVIRLSRRRTNASKKKPLLPKVDSSYLSESSDNSD